jgi:transcriptional regulator with XRE-family HTH domain
MHWRIRDCREDKDLTQKQVGEILGIDQRVYSTYETGKRQMPVNYLVKLALLYKTSVDYLIGLTNNPMPYERTSIKSVTQP